MRCRRDTTWLWNTGQDKKSLFTFCLLLLTTGQVCARPDFIDSMSRQFFGLASENNGQRQQQNYQSSPDPFAHMFGSASEHVPQRPAPQNYQHPNQHQTNPPHRQGYYPPQHVVQQQLHPPYNGPPPVYGQQQGFGQRQPNSNGTTTDGYPPDNQRYQYVHQGQHPHQEAKHPYPPVEYQPHHQHQQAVAVEYQPHYPPPQQVEYHHVPVAEHEGPTLEIHTGTQHAYKEPPTHIEYHHPPKVEYHHYTTHKPKRFHLSFNEPSPDYRIIDKHLKLPPVKFRFHINPKIVITSNTKDPLDKKHHDDEHDLEPFPPPDAFSDPNAPPQISKHIVEHYPVKHHYPIEHHAVEHYAAEYPQAKHAYPVEHHSVEHHPVHGYTYDLSQGHSHLNPHRSLGHYEPTFKIKTKPIIFTEPPPTRPTTTPRPTTTTARTTTTRRTTTARTTTTARPTRRARISARNPGFSVAFTQSSTDSTTTDASTTASTTTRRNNSERERENDGISARRDEVSTSAETSSSTRTTPSTTSMTTTPRPSTASTTTTTTTTMEPTTSTTTTTTVAPTTTSTTTTTTVAPTTTSSTTTPKPATTSTTTTTTAPSTTAVTTQIFTTSLSTTQSTAPPTTTTTTPTTTTTATTTTTTTAAPTSQSTSKTPAEETTPRSTTLSIDANEIDMRKATESPRRRLEPLQAGTSVIERSESFNLESSESVKVIETTMLIDGKNQTVRFYYITQPVKLPFDVFQKMTGQGKGNPSGVNVIKIRDKRFVLNDRSISDELQTLDDL